MAQSEQAERTAPSNDAWLRQGAADARGEITELLCQWQQGSQEAQELLFRKIYHLLHRLAARRLDEHGMATSFHTDWPSLRRR